MFSGVVLLNADTEDPDFDEKLKRACATEIFRMIKGRIPQAKEWLYVNNASAKVQPEFYKTATGMRLTYKKSVLRPYP
jgi:hypothetical protein